MESPHSSRSRLATIANSRCRGLRRPRGGVRAWAKPVLLRTLEGKVNTDGRLIVFRENTVDIPLDEACLSGTNLPDNQHLKQVLCFAARRL